MKKKSEEVSEQRFTEGKAHYHLCSVMQYGKSCFMKKNFEKLRVVVLNFSNLVLERYCRNMENYFFNV